MSSLQKVGLWASIAGNALFLVVAAVAIPSYLSNRDSLVKMQTTIELLNQRMSERKADTENKVQAVEDRRQSVKTPQQAVEAIQQSAPGVKIILSNPVQTSTAEVSGQLPDAPSAVIDRDSLFVLNNKLAECEKDGIRLKACEADKRDLASQRDSAVRAVKGSFWKRFMNCGVRVGVGAAAGGLSKDYRIAGAGAAIGLGSCFVVKP